MGSDETRAANKPDIRSGDAVPHFSRELFSDKEFVGLAKEHIKGILYRYNRWAEAENKAKLDRSYSNQHIKPSYDEMLCLYKAALLSDISAVTGADYNRKKGIFERKDSKGRTQILELLSVDIDLHDNKKELNAVERRNMRREVLSFCAREMAGRGLFYAAEIGEDKLAQEPLGDEVTNRNIAAARFFFKYRQKMQDNLVMMDGEQVSLYLGDVPNGKITGDFSEFLEAIEKTAETIRTNASLESRLESGFVQAIIDYSVLLGARELKKNWEEKLKHTDVPKEDIKNVIAKLDVIIEHYQQRYESGSSKLMDASMPGVPVFRRLLTNLLVHGIIGGAVENEEKNLKVGKHSAARVLWDGLGAAIRTKLAGDKNICAMAAQEQARAVDFLFRQSPLTGITEVPINVAERLVLDSPHILSEILASSEYAEVLRNITRDIIKVLDAKTPSDPAILAMAGKIVTVDDSRDKKSAEGNKKIGGGLDGETVRKTVNDESLRTIMKDLINDPEATLTIGTGSGYNEFADSVSVVNAVDRCLTQDGEISNPDKHQAIFMYNVADEKGRINTYSSLFSVREKPYGRNAIALADKLDKALSDLKDIPPHGGVKYYPRNLPDVLSRITITGGSLGAETAVQALEILRDRISEADVMLDNGQLIAAKDYVINVDGKPTDFATFAVRNSCVIGISGVATPSSEVSYLGMNQLGDPIRIAVGDKESSVAFTKDVLAAVQNGSCLQDEEKKKFWQDIPIDSIAKHMDSLWQ